jgi:glycosyltransferase involved in cell wall biosynthesis
MTDRGDHVKRRTDERLSVVVPCYNEQEVLPEFHRRLSAVMEQLGLPWEVVYVNDGSSDGTLDLMHKMHGNHPEVAVVDLSRNFGKEVAMTAGLEACRGDAVIVIDADLQDPPEVIPQLVAEWRAGYDMVYARRESRAGETAVKKATARWFYRVIGKLSRVRIPADTGDFRLLSRRTVEALLKLREQHRFMKGLFAWVGFPQKAVMYRRDPRLAGDTKWNYWKLWNFAVEGITSFSTVPLRLATYCGIGIAFIAFVYAGWIFYKTLAYGDPVKGYPSLMVVVLFLGGGQLIGIGVLGEYLGRVFNETKNRPLYFLNEHLPSALGRAATSVEDRDD